MLWTIMKICIRMSAIRMLTPPNLSVVKKERYQNRFNYYNSVVATLALILSIIGIILGLN